MKITHNKIGQNLSIKDSARTDETNKLNDSKQNGKLSSADFAELGATKVDLSPRAQEMKKIKEAALAAPDIDEEKVARLQKLIDQGQYKVDAKEIADKMVDEQVMWG